MDWNISTFFHTNEHQMRCSLCPHFCKFEYDGEVGKCHVRRRKNNRLETASFAISIQHLDTIERKPLYHYKPGTKVLTLATAGCTFQCLYCQNHRLSQFGRSPQALWQTTSVKIDEIITHATTQQAVIGFSYAEPTLNAELTLALAEVAAENSIDMIWKTNGFITLNALKKLAPCLAAVNVDLKSPDNRQHQKLTGAPLTPVLEAIGLFYDAGVWVEISTPLIPKFNTDSQSICRMAEFIVSIDPNIPWHLGRFNPDFKLRKLPPTSMEILAQARYTGLTTGLKHVYVERALGPQGRTTYCQSCSTPLIIRKIGEVAENFLHHGACPVCKTALIGRW